MRLRAKFSFPAIVALVCLCLPLARNATAQDRVALRPNLPAGANWSFVQNETADMSSSYKANGQSQDMKQKVQRKISGNVQVLESINGKPTALRVTFDRDCGGVMDNGQGQQMPMPFPMAGKTINVKIDAQGNLTHDAGQLNPDDLQELSSIAESDDAFLPKQPVAIGESWQPDIATLARKWQLDPQNSKIGVKMTLREVRDMGGRRVALVDAVLDVSGEMPGGMTGGRSMAGTTLIDLETGKAIQMQAQGKMSMSGINQQQGPDGNMYVMEMKSDGVVTTQSEARLGGAGAPAPAPGGFGGGGNNPAPAPGGFGGGNNPAPAPGGFGGGGNNPAPAPGGFGGGNNPAPAPAPAGTSPEGNFTFRDQNLTLAFTNSGNVPAITGTITMQGTTYPVKVKQWDGKTLAGAFTADGTDFDFTGTMQGDTLVFKTGDTEYQLKAAQPAKKNPLAK
ncbi:hypothetical protein BH09PLA1_BH09PLA1_19450 [soil metagenome]